MSYHSHPGRCSKGKAYLCKSTAQYRKDA